MVDLYAAARVPAFRRVDRYHPGPDRSCRSGAIPGNAWTHTQTHKHQPPNFFSPSHRRRSAFIRTYYAKALAPFIFYDFGTRGRHCLIALPWAKIVDVAIFRFGSGLVFTTNVPFQFARAFVHDAPHHLVSFTIELLSLNLIIVPIFTSLRRRFVQRSRCVHVHCTCTMHHITPSHARSNSSRRTVSLYRISRR